MPVQTTFAGWLTYTEAGAEVYKSGDDEKGVGAQTDVGVHATLR